jgi:hypothetical protein
MLHAVARRVIETMVSKRAAGVETTGGMAGAGGLPQTGIIDHSHGHAGRLAIKLAPWLKNPYSKLFR